VTNFNLFCHICSKLFQVIRLLIIISLLAVVFSSCVDTLPVVPQSEDRKLFVICEMKVGTKISANVSLAGNTKGLKNELITLDTIKMSLVEGEKDFGVNFVQEFGRDYNYVNPINLLIGENYKFRGIGRNSNNLEPAIIIPQAASIDSIKAIRKDSKIVNGKAISKVIVTIDLSAAMSAESYLYIDAKLPNGHTCNFSFDKDFHAYKLLTHRKGFLVDYNRISNRKLEFIAEVSELVASDMISIEISNATKSFYDFNYYYSNAGTSTDYIPDNQAIASFNIQTGKAIGSFSAMHSITKDVLIK
jgi:hypothetical protein